MKNKLIVGLTFAAFILNSQTHATPAYSWNLAREFAAQGNTTNPLPGGVWTLMYDNLGTTHNQANYVAFPVYSSSYYIYPYAFSNWTIQGSTNILAGVAEQDFAVGSGQIRHGDIVIHPNTDKAVIVKWNSPISGKVSVSGAVLDVDGSCGTNGIRWFFDKGNIVLMKGAVANGNHGMSFIQQNIPVSVGTALYFIVDSNGNQDCDTTKLDLMISSP